MIHILEAGVRSTLQDLGRAAHSRIGVPEAGPADPFAHAAANALVGNPAGDCAIEIVGLPFSVRCDDARVVAATGPDVWAEARRRVPGWMAVFLRAGEELTVHGSARTRYAYLAVSGGVDVPPVLGSRSAYPAAGLGAVPRALVPGDSLPLGAPRASARPGARIASPSYEGAVALLAGPHRDRFTERSVRALFAEPFRALAESDRMGLRLEGPALEQRVGELITCGLVAGALQVPRGGAPIVALADRGTTGGYPLVAVVAAADLGRVAQAPAGDELRFYEVDRERAVADLRDAGRALVPATD